VRSLDGGGPGPQQLEHVRHLHVLDVQVEVGLHAGGEAQALGARGRQQRRHRDVPRQLHGSAAHRRADVLHRRHVALQVESPVFDGHDRLS
jgi:hypothetical protein